MPPLKLEVFKLDSPGGAAESDAPELQPKSRRLAESGL
jgi:hypothetical protein